MIRSILVKSFAIIPSGVWSVTSTGLLFTIGTLGGRCHIETSDLLNPVDTVNTQIVSRTLAREDIEPKISSILPIDVSTLILGFSAFTFSTHTALTHDPSQATGSYAGPTSRTSSSRRPEGLLKSHLTYPFLLGS